MFRSLAVLVLLAFALPACSAEWPGWRGPQRDGISPEKDFPLSWSANDHVRWKAALPGLGVSAPIVWGDNVLLTSSGGRAGEELHLICLDGITGKARWHRRMFGTELSDGQYTPGGMAVPTPTTDGTRIFALYGTGDLVCVDMEGKPLWIRSLASEYGAFRNRWGMASSPLLLEGLLVVQVDHWPGSYLLGVDPATGKNRWKTPRGIGIDWTSPVAAKVGGRTLILATGTNTLRAYDAANGKEVWSLPGMQNQCIPTPVVADGRVWLSAGKHFTSLCVRLGEKPEVEWKQPSKGANIPSPVCVGGYYYYAEDAGFIACLRADTGERVWRQRLGNKVHASPVAVGDRIYFPCMNGTVTVVRAGPRFEVLAKNDVGEGIVASPAFSRGRIYLRGEKHLFCIGGK